MTSDDDGEYRCIMGACHFYIMCKGFCLLRFVSELRQLTRFLAFKPVEITGRASEPGRGTGQSSESLRGTGEASELVRETRCTSGLFQK